MFIERTPDFNEVHMILGFAFTVDCSQIKMN